jgi:hypothetical protein
MQPKIVKLLGCYHEKGAFAACFKFILLYLS